MTTVTKKKKKVAKPAAAKSTAVATTTGRSVLTSRFDDRQKKLMEGLSPEAKKVFTNEFLPVIEKAESDEMIARFRLGTIIYRLMEDEDKYGNSVVETYGNIVSISSSTLRDCAAVSKWFEGNESAFQQAVKTANSQGYVIGFNHLVEISRFPGNSQRETILKQAIKKKMTVAEVRKVVSKAKAKKKGSKGADSISFVSASSATKKVTSAARKITELFSKWDDEILAGLADTDLEEDDIDLLRQAQEALTETVTSAQKALEDVEAKLAAEEEAAEGEEPEEEEEEEEETEVKAKKKSAKSTKAEPKASKKSTKKKVEVEEEEEEEEEESEEEESEEEEDEEEEEEEAESDEDSEEEEEESEEEESEEEESEEEEEEYEEEYEED